MFINEYFTIETTNYEIKQNGEIIGIKIKSEQNEITHTNKKSKLEIKFLLNGNIKILLGFSININKLNVSYDQEVFQIDEISSLDIITKQNNILYLEPDELKSTYEIYIRVENFKENLNFDKFYNTVSNSIVINMNSKKPVKKIFILLTGIIKSIGEFFKMIFNKRSIDCELIYQLKPSDCFNFYYNKDWILLILFYSESHLLLPNRIIYYQIEQKNSIFLTDEKKLKKTLCVMRKSEKVWNFTESIKNIYEKNCVNKLFTVPMPFVKFTPEIKYFKNFDKCKYDVFFYGSPNEKRKNILEKLSGKFNVKIGFDCYGEEKFIGISESKIILNLHYYKEAGLETCRINEILNYKKVIISEKSNSDKINMELYKDLVIFIDEIDEKNLNKGLEQLIKYISYYLKKNNYTKFINTLDENLEILEKKIDSMILI